MREALPPNVKPAIAPKESSVEGEVIVCKYNTLFWVSIYQQMLQYESHENWTRSTYFETTQDLKNLQLPNLLITAADVQGHVHTHTKDNLNLNAILFFK